MALTTVKRPQSDKEIKLDGPLFSTSSLFSAFRVVRDFGSLIQSETRKLGGGENSHLEKLRLAGFSFYLHIKLLSVLINKLFFLIISTLLEFFFLHNIVSIYAPSTSIALANRILKFCTVGTNT